MEIEIELSGPASGPDNMAADLQILQLAEHGKRRGRVYFWDGPWVSLGRFQDPAQALVSGYEKFVLRPTGGKAVLHGHDLTFSMAIPFEGRAVRRADEIVLRPVLAALADCGLPAEVAGLGRESRDLSADCFASTSAYDVVLSGSQRKVAGAAMRIGHRALLLQVSIPYDDPLIDPASAIVGAIAEPSFAWDWRAFGGAVEIRSRQQDLLNL